MLKTIRNNVVDATEKIIRKSGFSDKTICNILRFIHFGVSIVTGCILLFCSVKWFLFVVILDIIVFILFCILDGCILSRLEHKFSKDDFTVIDPLLMLIGLDLTNNNRYKYTIISNVFVAFAIACLYFLRFG